MWDRSVSRVGPTAAWNPYTTGKRGDETKHIDAHRSREKESVDSREKKRKGTRARETGASHRAQTDDDVGGLEIAKAALLWGFSLWL